MMEIFFYIFSFLLVTSSLGVVLFKNPIYAVLSLIFAFLNCAGLFILLKAEFLAMLIIIIYVGAVAVLFLFVIMMIGNNIAKKIYSKKIFAFAFIVFSVFFFEMLFIIFIGFSKYELPNILFPIPANVTNTEAIGSILYSQFMLPFEISAVILLVAMVGSVALTHRIRDGVKKQNINEQLSKNPQNSINLIKLKPGKSIYDNE
jgi:NADH-quinone oxidoreductase subunit J